MRLLFIAGARMPSEKAHGIQIAKMCEAFLDEGLDLTLIVPVRRTTKKSVQEFYGLHRPIPIVYLPVLDWYDRGRIGYFLSALSFMCSYTLYLLRHGRKPGTVVYTVDLDHVTYAPIALLGIPFFVEMHGGKPSTWIHYALFARARGIIPTNPITKEQIQKEFGVMDDRFIVEPNGVDFSAFAVEQKDAARDELGLASGMKLALYVGRFFDWKGLEILSQAVKLLPPDITLAVIGDSADKFIAVTKEQPGRIVFYGEKPYTQIPQWASAADALLVLGTKRDEQSFNYTSPMKVFEYMALKRPIVASRTPALKSILGDDECIFYEPDNAHSLAGAIERAVGESADNAARSGRAYENVQRYAWISRARRISEFMRKKMQH